MHAFRVEIEMDTVRKRRISRKTVSFDRGRDAGLDERRTVCRKQSTTDANALSEERRASFVNQNRDSFFLSDNEKTATYHEIHQSASAAPKGQNLYLATGSAKVISAQNMYDSLTRRATIPKLKTELNIPPKSLCLIPSRFAIRMIEQGWILRNEIIWHKPNMMPQSVADRFSVDFEKIFFFVKSRKYYFRQQFEPLKDTKRLKRRLLDPKKNHKCTKSYWFSANPTISDKRRLKMFGKGRNKRCVWTIGTVNFSGNHFAVYPPRIVETPILAGCPKGGIVLDPFVGSGTTAIVAEKLNRQFIAIELNPEYVKIASKRLRERSIESE